MASIKTTSPASAPANQPAGATNYNNIQGEDIRRNASVKLAAPLPPSPAREFVSMLQKMEAEEGLKTANAYYVARLCGGRKEAWSAEAVEWFRRNDFVRSPEARGKLTESFLSGNGITFVPFAKLLAGYYKFKDIGNSRSLNCTDQELEATADILQKATLCSLHWQYLEAYQTLEGIRNIGFLQDRAENILHSARLELAELETLYRVEGGFGIAGWKRTTAQRFEELPPIKSEHEAAWFQKLFPKLVARMSPEQLTEFAEFVHQQRPDVLAAIPADEVTVSAIREALETHGDLQSVYLPSLYVHKNIQFACAQSILAENNEQLLQAVFADKCGSEFLGPHLASLLTREERLGDNGFLLGLLGECLSACSITDPLINLLAERGCADEGVAVRLCEIVAQKEVGRTTAHLARQLIKFSPDRPETKKLIEQAICQGEVGLIPDAVKNGFRYEAVKGLCRLFREKDVKEACQLFAGSSKNGFADEDLSAMPALIVDALFQLDHAKTGPLLSGFLAQPLFASELGKPEISDEAKTLIQRVVKERGVLFLDYLTGICPERMTPDLAMLALEAESSFAKEAAEARQRVLKVTISKHAEHPHSWLPVLEGVVSAATKTPGGLSALPDGPKLGNSKVRDELAKLARKGNGNPKDRIRAIEMVSDTTNDKALQDLLKIASDEVGMFEKIFRRFSAPSLDDQMTALRALLSHPDPDVYGNACSYVAGIIFHSSHSRDSVKRSALIKLSAGGPLVGMAKSFLSEPYPVSQKEQCLRLIEKSLPVGDSNCAELLISTAKSLEDVRRLPLTYWVLFKSIDSLDVSCLAQEKCSLFKENMESLFNECPENSLDCLFASYTLLARKLADSGKETYLATLEPLRIRLGLLPGNTSPQAWRNRLRNIPDEGELETV